MRHETRQSHRRQSPGSTDETATHRKLPPPYLFYSPRTDHYASQLWFLQVGYEQHDPIGVIPFRDIARGDCERTDVCGWAKAYFRVAYLVTDYLRGTFAGLKQSPTLTTVRRGERWCGILESSFTNMRKPRCIESSPWKGHVPNGLFFRAASGQAVIFRPNRRFSMRRNDDVKKTSISV
jgi:hypothetical protein